LSNVYDHVASLSKFVCFIYYILIVKGEWWKKESERRRDRRDSGRRENLSGEKRTCC